MQLLSPRLVSSGWCVEIDGVTVMVAMLNSDVLHNFSPYTFASSRASKVLLATVGGKRFVEMTHLVFVYHFDTIEPI